MRHYLTQAGSKAKSNGAMLKAGSDIDLSDEIILKPGKSDQNSASRKKFDKQWENWRHHDRVHRGLGA
jgi:hypothetical protein